MKSFDVSRQLHNVADTVKKATCTVAHKILSVEFSQANITFSASRLKQFMEHCLSLRIMVPLEKMQTNCSVPCYKGDGDNILATRYNHKIILVDDTYWLVS